MSADMIKLPTATAHLILAFLVSSVAAHQDWLAYKAEHGKIYHSLAEDTLRQMIFNVNKAEVERFNELESTNASFTLALNHMSDWTSTELRQSLGTFSWADQANTEHDQIYLDDLLFRDEPPPKSVDWREVTDRVTEVQDQGKCGCSWAFATTGLLEGQEVQHASKGGIPLSNQNLVDCSKSNTGCHGGNMAAALRDIITLGGINAEKSYPYEGIDGKCRFNNKSSVIVNVNQFQLDSGNETLLMLVVAYYGPVAVGVSVTDRWTHYKSGILYDPACEGMGPNHAALVVGYGTDDESGKDYWIIKNSLSKKWGADGYVYLARNKNNHCNVATCPILATF